jgi:hypothetical protein
MLTWIGPKRLCRGALSRRDVLQAGVLAFGGLTLPDLLRHRLASTATASPSRFAPATLFRTYGSLVAIGVLALVVTSVGYGVLGVALGLLLRNQTTALVTALVWQFVVEGVLPVVLRAPSLPTYLPGGAVSALVRLGHHTAHGALPAWQGGALFTAYAVGLVLVAMVVAVPRDVT